MFAGPEGLRASPPAIRAKSRRARSTSGIRVDNNLLIELKKRKDERALSEPRSAVFNEDEYLNLLGDADAKIDTDTERRRSGQMAVYRV